MNKIHFIKIPSRIVAIPVDMKILKLEKFDRYDIRLYFSGDYEGELKHVAIESFRPGATIGRPGFTYTYIGSHTPRMVHEYGDTRDLEFMYMVEKIKPKGQQHLLTTMRG